MPPLTLLFDAISPPLAAPDAATFSRRQDTRVTP